MVHYPLRSLVSSFKKGPIFFGYGSVSGISSGNRCSYFPSSLPVWCYLPFSTNILRDVGLLIFAVMSVFM